MQKKLQIHVMENLTLVDIWENQKQWQPLNKAG